MLHHSDLAEDDFGEVSHCRRFTLPFTPQTIQRNAEKAAAEDCGGDRGEVPPRGGPKAGSRTAASTPRQSPAVNQSGQDRHLAGERLTATKRRQLQQRDELQV